ncbi:MAG: hypothetical protein ACOYBY_00595 [Dermatophilaceae bacterium]
MTHLYVTLRTLAATVRARAEAAVGQGRRDSGITTLEMVFWAVGLLSLAGVVYAALQAYINSKTPGIR